MTMYNFLPDALNFYEGRFIARDLIFALGVIIRIRRRERGGGGERVSLLVNRNELRRVRRF